MGGVGPSEVKNGLGDLDALANQSPRGLSQGCVGARKSARATLISSDREEFFAMSRSAGRTWPCQRRDWPCHNNRPVLRLAPEQGGITGATRFPSPTPQVMENLP